MACNRRIVRRLWQRRAFSFRCCVNVNCTAIRWAYFREQRPALAHIGASIAVAVRIWHSVRAGFFPPVLESELAEEHMAEATEDQMPLNREELAYLKMIHAQFSLANLKATLNGPPRKSHP